MKTTKPKPFASFPATLKRLRARAKLTQVEAADKLGIPYKTWVSWEQGRFEPSLLMQTAVLERL